MPPAAKRAAMLHWIQKSGTVHSIKDLEKALPSVGSINGMQVKEYVQAMLDENEIRVEKIGSGNWYWSFPSEDKLRKEEALDRAQTDRDKSVAALAELRQKLDEAEAARKEDEGMLMGGDGMSRKDLMERNDLLTEQAEVLKKELASYSGNDPLEVERRKRLVETMKNEAEKHTDHIQSMEGWIRSNAGVDRETIINMKRSWYGDQFDEEQQCLKEI
jgi:hypothetical protein